MADDPRRDAVTGPGGEVPAGDPAPRDDDDARDEGARDEGPGDPDPREAPGPEVRQTFLGEIVQRRSWPLVALVFLFGLFLAVVPFLFGVEKSPFTAALALYDESCASRTAPPDVPCVPRNAYRPRMDPVEGRQFGSRREFVVTLERRPDAPPDPAAPPVVRFRVADDEGKVSFLPWPDGLPR